MLTKSGRAEGEEESRNLGWAPRIHPTMTLIHKGSFCLRLITEPCWKPGTGRTSHTWETGESGDNHNWEICQVKKLPPPSLLPHIWKLEDEQHLVAAALETCFHTIINIKKIKIKIKYTSYWISKKRHVSPQHCTFKNLKKMPYASLLFSNQMENISLRKFHASKTLAL